MYYFSSHGSQYLVPQNNKLSLLRNLALTRFWPESVSTLYPLLASTLHNYNYLLVAARKSGQQLGNRTEVHWFIVTA